MCVGNGDVCLSSDYLKGPYTFSFHHGTPALSTNFSCVIIKPTNNICRRFAESRTEWVKEKQVNRITVIMRQILEKCYEYNIEMHVLFIDFKRVLTLLTDKKLYRYYRN
jgi:hypothetical protein